MNFPQLDTFVWVIPGVFYIYYYNKFTPFQNIKISGWPYLFTIVIISFAINIPDYLLNNGRFDENLTQYTWLFQFVLYCILLWLPKVEWVKQFLPRIKDDFYNKCTEWHKKAVLLTLKNGKVYVGTLWKYPDPNLQYELQIISIHPSFSGYREQNDKRTEWTTYYPETKDNTDMELIIPRSEIVTFSKFNQEVHTHFEEIKEFRKQHPFSDIAYT